MAAVGHHSPPREHDASLPIPSLAMSPARDGVREIEVSGGGTDTVDIAYSPGNTADMVPKSVVDSLQVVCASQSNALFNMFVIGITFGGEQLFSRFSFTCPCEHPANMRYGLAFIAAPALALFIIGVILNQSTWRFRRDGTQHGYCRSFYYWVSIVGQAAVAPTAWLFIAFLDGSYFSCMHAAEFCADVGHNTTTIGDILPVIMQEWPAFDDKVNGSCICDLPDQPQRHLRAVSQVIAWQILLVALVVMVVVLCLSRCCDRYTYVQNEYVRMYRQEEKKEFDLIAKDHAQQQARANSRSFFVAVRSANKRDWDKVAMVPLSDYPYCLDVIRRYFTMCNMHRRREQQQQMQYLTPLDHWAKQRRKVEAKWKSLIDLKEEHSRPLLEEEEEEEEGMRIKFIDSPDEVGGKDFVDIGPPPPMGILFPNNYHADSAPTSTHSLLDETKKQ